MKKSLVLIPATLVPAFFLLVWSALAPLGPEVRQPSSANAGGDASDQESFISLMSEMIQRTRLLNRHEDAVADLEKGLRRAERVGNHFRVKSDFFTAALLISGTGSAGSTVAAVSKLRTPRVASSGRYVKLKGFGKFGAIAVTLGSIAGVSTAAKLRSDQHYDLSREVFLELQTKVLEAKEALATEREVLQAMMQALGKQPVELFDEGLDELIAASFEALDKPRVVAAIEEKQEENRIRILADSDGGIPSLTALKVHSLVQGKPELEAFLEKVTPVWSLGTFGYYQVPERNGDRAGELFFGIFAPEDGKAKKTVVLFTGRGTSFVQWMETIADLVGRGFQVVGVDRRGLGFSSRLIDGDTQKLHISSFDTYVDDYVDFVEGVAVPAARLASPEGHQLFSLSHSLGSHIYLRVAAKLPGVFDRSLLIAPMFDAKTIAGIPAKNLFKAIQGSSSQAPTDFALSQGPYKAKGLEQTDSTGSDLRHNVGLAMDDIYDIMKIGGSTKGWVDAMLASIEVGQKDLASVATNDNQVWFILPMGDRSINLKLAETASSLVLGAGQEHRLLKIPGARHDLLREEDQYRLKMLEVIDRAFVE